MKINATHQSLYSSQSVPPKANRSSSDASFASTLAAATSAVAQNADAANVGPTDFTSMTRKDLFDWMNSQIRSGQMTVEESSPFLGMTVRIAANAGSSALTPMDDTERVDFIDLARTGIDDAQSRKETMTEKMLRSALSIMQRHQGQASSVDAQG